MREKSNLRTRGPHGLGFDCGWLLSGEGIGLRRAGEEWICASFAAPTLREVEAITIVIPECPFVNLPEKKQSGWGLGLTAEDMKDPGSRGQKRIQAGCEMKQPSPVVVGMSYTDCRTHAWLKILRFFPSIFGQNSLG